MLVVKLDDDFLPVNFMDEVFFQQEAMRKEERAAQKEQLRGKK